MDMTDPEYSPAEVEFLQCLLDRYSSTGNLVRADDNPAFMEIVRKHYGEPLADRTGMTLSFAKAELFEALGREMALTHIASSEAASEDWIDGFLHAVSRMYTALANLREAQE